MKSEEEVEFEEFITFMEKIHTLVGDKANKREEGWDTFLSFIDEVQGDLTIWKSPDFQKRVKDLCKSIDCRLLDAESWETTDELELLAQLSLRNSEEDDDFEELEDEIDDEDDIEEADKDTEIEIEEESLEDFEEEDDFSLEPDLFDVPIDEFKMIAPKDVLGLFVLLDRYLEFYGSFLKRSEYALLSTHLPENSDGTKVTSELK